MPLCQAHAPFAEDTLVLSVPGAVGSVDASGQPTAPTTAVVLASYRGTASEDRQRLARYAGPDSGPSGAAHLNPGDTPDALFFVDGPVAAGVEGRTDATAVLTYGPRSNRVTRTGTVLGIERTALGATVVLKLPKPAEAAV